MVLILPLSADLPYMFFCLKYVHSEEDRTAVLSNIKDILKDELFEEKMVPERACTWIVYIYHAASESLLNISKLENMMPSLLAMQNEFYAIQLRTELLAILSKSASRSIEASDADSIRRIKDEAALAKIDEPQLGYTLNSLEVIADGIANGDFQQATA